MRGGREAALLGDFADGTVGVSQEVLGFGEAQAADDFAERCAERPLHAQLQQGLRAPDPTGERGGVQVVRQVLPRPLERPGDEGIVDGVLLGRGARDDLRVPRADDASAALTSSSWRND